MSRLCACACALGLLLAAYFGGLLPGAAKARPEAVARIGASTAVCPQLFGSFAAGKWPPACWRPYGPSSPFNRELGPNPRLSRESSAIVGYMNASGWSFERARNGGFALPVGGSRPVYWSQRSDPIVRVRCVDHFSCLRGLRLRIPRQAQAQGESDGHMTVVDQLGGHEYDFWQASTPSEGEMTAAAASSIPIGADRGTGLHGDGEAAYLGLLGGLIRAPELAAGRIEHALAAAVPCVQWRDVWPAPRHGRGDATCDGRRGDGPHLGSLLRLDMSEAQIMASGAPPWQRTIMRAMARYGIYVVDTNGAGNLDISLIEEAEESFTSFGVDGPTGAFARSLGTPDKLIGVPIDLAKLRVVAPCVAQQSC
ncbi:MAG TPA: hypothetical protein VHW67_13475 [Solirubrobacteraceae bacterium]|nr:hypothetical protein [Solirubrobacteraceae bacterium]